MLFPEAGSLTSTWAFLILLCCLAMSFRDLPVSASLALGYKQPSFQFVVLLLLFCLFYQCGFWGVGWTRVPMLAQQAYILLTELFLAHSILFFTISSAQFPGVCEMCLSSHLEPQVSQTEHEAGVCPQWNFLIHKQYLLNRMNDAEKASWMTQADCVHPIQARTGSLAQGARL